MKDLDLIGHYTIVEKAGWTELVLHMHQSQGNLTYAHEHILATAVMESDGGDSDMAKIEGMKTPQKIFIILS